VGVEAVDIRRCMQEWVEVCLQAKTALRARGEVGRVLVNFIDASRKGLELGRDRLRICRTIGGYLAHLRHIDFSPTQKSSLP
jgi:hypothetical protein